MRSIYRRRSLLVRLRLRVALVVVWAMLVGGVAHASHFHDGDLDGHGDVHGDCLLCMYMAGSAASPEIPALVSDTPNRFPIVPGATPAPQGVEAAPYDARGPPRV